VLEAAELVAGVPAAERFAGVGAVGFHMLPAPIQTGRLAAVQTFGLSGIFIAKYLKRGCLHCSRAGIEQHKRRGERML